MLSDETDEDIVFFGGKDYLPQFCALTGAIMSQKKIVFYNSGHVPQATGCTLKKFETSARTNWHYECVNDLPGGNFGDEQSHTR